MRLLKVDDLTFQVFPPDKTPKYAIASHRWGDEAGLKDVLKRRNTDKTGYQKIEGFARYVREHLPSIQYLWIDTCCIDQKSSQEVSEAIRSMFAYYREAAVCLAYLSDVEQSDDMDSFRSSVWHTRGWTLQELLAPRTVIFLAKDWQIIGRKGERLLGQECQGLETTISSVSGLPEDVLVDFTHAARYSIEEKNRWAVGRQTMKPEDRVYCLFGIFGTHVAIEYGEGYEEARKRLFAAVGRPDPEARRLPVCVMQYQRDGDFVERPELLEQIQIRLSMKTARVALVGLGGVGKTQLALEYAWRVRETQPDTSVLWVHASNRTRLQQSVGIIVRRIGISGHEAANADLTMLLETWLATESNGRWLLVLDNVDDADVLLAPHGTSNSSQNPKRWLDHLPICEHGSVLITSRSLDQARRVVSQNSIIEVPIMAQAQAKDLLTQKLDSASDQGSLEQLAEALDHMPLAMTQAAAFIRQRAPRYTVQRYLDELVQSRERRTDLLTWDPKFLERDNEASSSILLTWQISFEYLREHRRSAADLLSLMSLCDRQAIPELLIHKSAASIQSDGPNTQVARDTFEDDIVSLRNFSFVSATTTIDAWQMHRLVQDATRRWMLARDELDVYSAVLARCLAHVCPKWPKFEDWDLCRTMLPHVKAALELKPSEEALLSWARVMCGFSDYAEQQGNYQDAEIMAKLSFDCSNAKEVLGEQDQDIIAFMNNLALMYSGKGAHTKAEEIQLQVLDARIALSGEEDAETLIHMYNLALTYNQQGRHQTAKDLLEKTLKIRKRISGEDHPDTLKVLSDLAHTYSRLGDHAKAAEMCQKVLDSRKKYLPEDHEDTLICMNNLAFSLGKQGELDRAIKLSTQVVERQTKVRGPEDKNTLTSMHNLAFSLGEQGELDRAIEVFTQVVERRTKVLGPEDKDTLTSMHDLAFYLGKQRELDRAIELFTQVVERRTKVLGPEDRDTLSSMHNLAFYLAESGQLKAAEALMSQAIDGRRKVLGPDHEHTKFSVQELHWIRSQLRDQQAIDQNNRDPEGGS